MQHRKLWFTGIAVAVTAGCAAHRASQGPVLGADGVRRLYDRLAPAYDATAWTFQLVGARRLRQRAIDLLDVHAGDTVVDLGCGTGVNLPVLARAVGEHGRVVGVDVSPGMLEMARRRVDRHRLPQVTLVEGDVRGFGLPSGTSAVLATASLEMVPEHDAVVREVAAQLSPTGGRLAVGGFRRPPTWPAWAVSLGRTATALFGVTQDYATIQPWRSVREHMDEVAFETAAAGALYLIVARTRSAPDEDSEPSRASP